MSDAIQVGENAADGPLSVVVTRRIKPGCERAYEELVKGIHEAIKGFDGYLGSHTISPNFSSAAPTRRSLHHRRMLGRQALDLHRTDPLAGALIRSFADW